MLFSAYSRYFKKRADCCLHAARYAERGSDGRQDCVPPDLHAWKKIYLALRENKFSLKGKYIQP